MCVAIRSRSSADTLIRVSGSPISPKCALPPSARSGTGLCLREDLRQAGIDPARLDRIADRSMAENLNALSECRIEAAQFFEPDVEEALASGKGQLWCAASTRGRTTYTAFATIRDRLVGDAEPLLRMVRAIRRTQQWISTRSAPEIAAAISSLFLAFDRRVLAAALARYQAQSVWRRDPVLPEDGFDRLRRCLVSGGFIRRPTGYAACVDNRLALRVLTE